MSKSKSRYAWIVLALVFVFTAMIAWNNQTLTKTAISCLSRRNCRQLEDDWGRVMYRKIGINNSPSSLGIHSYNRSSAYGKVRNETDIVVVFFAVPKTGSRSLSNPFNVLYTRANLSYIIVPMEQRINRKVLSTYLSNIHERSFVRGHFPVVELPSNYISISVLRDPLERFISEFNFVKYGDGQINTSKIEGHSAPDFLLTIDECVQQKSPFCSREVVSSYTLNYFCGFDAKCSVANEWTYQRAIQNVESMFLLVGVTEDLDSTMKLLERLLPNTAAGVENIYKQRQKEKRESYVTQSKEQPSPRIRDKLVRMMYWEYKFYNHVKSKFRDLKKTFGIPEG